MDKVGIYKYGEMTGIQWPVHARLCADGTVKEEMMSTATRMLDTRSCLFSAETVLLRRCF